jgi:ATP-dependent Lon protease
MAGGISGAMKESVQRAFSYVQAKKTELGIARDMEISDLHVEVNRPIDLLGNRVEAEVGRVFRGVLFRAQESACPPCAACLG